MELSKGPRRIFKQQQQTKLYSHTLNLNTIALQISQKMLFGAGKSNRIENNENESTYQYRTLWKHAFSTHIIKKKEQFCQDPYLFYPYMRKTRCPTYICIPLYPTPQYDNNKAHFFFLGTTFDFPFLSSSAFWRCDRKKWSNTYTL